MPQPTAAPVVVERAAQEIEVELVGGRRVRFAQGTDPGTVRSMVKFANSSLANRILIRNKFSVVGDNAGILSSIAISILQKQFSGGINDSLSIELVFSVEVEQIARLAKAVCAKRADAHALYASYPGQGSRRTIQYCDWAGTGCQCRQIGDLLD